MKTRGSSYTGFNEGHSVQLCFGYYYQLTANRQRRKTAWIESKKPSQRVLMDMAKLYSLDVNGKEICVVHMFVPRWFPAMPRLRHWFLRFVAAEGIRTHLL